MTDAEVLPAVPVAEAGSAVDINGREAFQGLKAAWLGSLSAGTRKTYGYAVADFARWLGLGVDDTLAALVSNQQSSFVTVGNYRAHLDDKGLAASTVSTRLAALRSFVAFCRRGGLVNWALEVRLPKKRSYRDTSGPGREAIFRMMELASGPTRPRDRAMMALAYFQGLRVGEIVGIDRDDLDLDRRCVWIRGKGRVDKEKVTLTSTSVEECRRWDAVRADVKPFFHNVDGGHPRGRLTTRSVQRIVKALGGLAGAQARPHGLRHTAITDALDATNGDIRKVQKFSRHRDPKVILAYDDDRRDLAGEVAGKLDPGDT